MSLFGRATITCTACAAEAEGEVVASLNADRRPDLRDAVLDGSFQSLVCASCETLLRLPPRFTYVDVERGQWIMAHPAADLPHWRLLEDEARTVFARGYGARAPAAAREIGDMLRPRITFGWPALRERLICRAHDLDDVTLELVKLTVMRNESGAPFSDDANLRLVDTDGGDLILQWSVMASEAVLSTLRVPREIYDRRAAAEPAWDSLREEFDDALLIDFARLLVA